MLSINEIAEFLKFYISKTFEVESLVFAFIKISMEATV